LHGDREVTAENRQIGADGTEHVFMMVKRPLVTPDGQRLVFGVGVDVAERKRQQEQLERKHAQLRAVMDAAPNIIFVKDAQHRYVMVNRAYCEVWGRSESELVGRDPADLMGDVARAWNAGDDEVLRSGRETVSENRQVAADGGERVILQVKRPFPGPDGELQVLGIGTDITDLRRQADLLARQQRLINDVIDLDRSFVLVKDAQLRYVLVNDAYARRLGRPKADIIGRTAWDLHPGNPVVDRMMDIDRQVLATGAEVVTEDALDLGDGPRRFVATRRPIGLPDGTMGVLSFIQDVTELRAAEESLRVALDRARAASVAKSRFLANMSHEIRTPINGVAGLIDLVLDAPVSDQQREWLRLARGSADTLLALVNDVLDLSKIEAGVMAVERAPFALQTLLGDAVRLLAARAREKGLQLDLLVDPALPEQVIGDSLRLRQVLLNLLGNAVKFTERGGVRMRARCVDGGRVAFEIDDDGPGIAPQQQQRVFEPFVQGDDSTTRRHGGTGLGLSISAQLVELMGGRLRLDSRPGRGASFRFELDLAAEPVPLVPCLSGRRIAWVAGRGPMAEHALAVLRAWGAQAEFVDAGADAPADGLWHAETWVLDVQAPRWLDAAIAHARREGVLRRLVCLTHVDRTLGELLAQLPSAAGLTGSGLALPFGWPAFLAAVGAAAAAPTPAAAPTVVLGTPLDGWRVLLVEDNEVNGLLAVATLERLGGGVDLARDGAEALERMERQRYDVVLMDIQMPRLDGLQALRRWRELELAKGLPRMPVLAMTAHAMRGDRARFLAEGFDGYVGKPFERADLVAEIRRAAAACRG
ncbi:MAG TPA: PAS domain-containing protein, partial [Burkholderiaceae bacterium]|nr:PAS domain-containing protein [Burkholderiaceae bacterium]